MNPGPGLLPYLQIVMHNLKVCELWKELVWWQRPLHHKLDLPRVGLELVSNLDPDAAHDDVYQVLHLGVKVAPGVAFTKFEGALLIFKGRRFP